MPSIRHTQGTLARQTHLPLLNPSPPILYFSLETVLRFVQYNLVYAILGVISLSFTVSHLPLQVFVLLSAGPKQFHSHHTPMHGF
ncbi:unnamed protein product [Hymenolepis diminuta]|uniref:Uncharacterized protein n=1 Tax=Hymenolepis diminuta TaxID=6216 RepID=A0A564Y7S2_HYMDI|nr:unnamed protein product [Hymenolepis diminuta]